jgi:hypothetical protein
MAAQVALRRQQVEIILISKLKTNSLNNEYIIVKFGNQAQEENEARELGMLYGCHEGLLAMHRAGFTFSAAMAQFIQVMKRHNLISRTFLK